jgi:hypothetical protein
MESVMIIQRRIGSFLKYLLAVREHTQIFEHVDQWTHEVTFRPKHREY